MSLIFNCPIKRLPITCLRLPIITESLNRPQREPLIEKVQKRLAGWKGMLLSLGSGLTMINAVLSAFTTYSLSFFPPPRWMERDIDSLMRKFLWNGVHGERKGFSLANWKRVCSARNSVVWGSSTSATSIEPYFSSGGGDYFKTRAGNGHHSFHTTINHAGDGGQTGLLI